MTDEPEICDVDECENSALVIVSGKRTTNQKYVCHECVMNAVSIASFK